MNFCSPLKEVSSAVDISDLDTQIQIIASYSQLLLKKLENQLSSWNDSTSTIGNIFLEYTDFMKVYTQYVKYHSTVQKSIKEERNNNKKFKKHLEVNTF